MSNQMASLAHRCFTMAQLSQRKPTVAVVKVQNQTKFIRDLPLVPIVSKTTQKVQLSITTCLSLLHCYADIAKQHQVNDVRPSATMKTVFLRLV